MNTTYTYQLTQYTSILRSDGASIPPDPANRDYAEYLAWIAAGNTPTPVPPQPNPAIAAIDAQLAALDIKRIRPTAEGDTIYLATLNQQAVDLRTQRAMLPLTI